MPKAVLTNPPPNSLNVSAILANPKTATTTIERWLSPDSVPGLTRIAGDARFKHANYRTFVGMMGAYGEPVAEYDDAPF